MKDLELFKRIKEIDFRRNILYVAFLTFVNWLSIANWTNLFYGGLEKVENFEMNIDGTDFGGAIGLISNIFLHVFDGIIFVVSYFATFIFVVIATLIFTTIYFKKEKEKEERKEDIKLITGIVTLLSVIVLSFVAKKYFSLLMLLIHLLFSGVVYLITKMRLTSVGKDIIETSKTRKGDEEDERDEENRLEEQ